ncbi:uncharacterized protein Z520_11965 [Fonsecaea multimorphosa CBS 102226]|uniref:t-SNARE coiled-coil homology domain-containing protein n=1 Tax=Fonsecaea multimorphosa CBS 102226 TaxID=1442371 RepID=A0A0D2JGQ4_9EURO|nr:uncharacterized protein Z520_11965 [Fonsecaea multimorphosa CBS 102226]KIX92357.1 hypothetical protein Z520_11965 [Fonsecaea multimorphosa CBS 102226]OAL17730.1 hypothetical protein AYO22_11386 [Fonsecaea multimorphosa]
MSLTTALRPVALPFGAGQRRDHSSTDNAQSRPFHHEVSYLNLHRTLTRYQQLILLTPSPSSSSDVHNPSELTALQKQVQAELWSPLPYHRTKWLHNVEGARTLLLQLERKAQAIRVQRAKYEAIKDLAEKRTVIKRLRDRIEEIGREVEMMGLEEWKPPVVEDGGETLYDFLQMQTQTQAQSAVTEGPAAKEGAQEAPLTEGKPIKSIEEEQPAEAIQKDKDTREELFGSSSLRQRGKVHGETKKSEGQASGVSTLAGTERSLLDSSRVHEDITASLVKMAAQLKQEQRKLQFSLEQDKGILGRAIEGLDVSLSGMEAASKNMAFLKRMSEEEGWFGRLKLYGMIFAMWVVAFLLVFVCPKLRFG